jgi:ATPase family associated with various cellular activities (AAA)
MRPWQQANRAHLEAVIRRVESTMRGDAPEADRWRGREAELAAAAPAAPALDRLAQTFQLSPAERDMLAMCAGGELGIGTPPTFAGLLAGLGDAEWSAITPGAPLRYWRLVEPAPGASIMRAPLHVDERVLHFLAGVQYLDERLDPLLRAARRPESTSYEAASTRIAAALTSGDRLPVIALSGLEVPALAAVAAHGAGAAGLNLYLMSPSDLPQAAGERAALARLWERDALLTGSALLFALDDTVPPAVEGFIERVGTPVFVASRWAVTINVSRPLHRIALDLPEPQLQVQAWERSLVRHGVPANGLVTQLVSQFRLAPETIAACCDGATAAVAPGAAPGVWEARIWDECRGIGRPRLDELAQRLDTRATWSDLVIPAAQEATLRQLLAHVRRRHTVHHTWGFAERGARGLGTGVIFAGPSGTGKTLAAEVIANALRLDLYRIDLSRVVSKYIGETEKNLRRVFDAAEYGGAVLLFDEADALFGKRSEVRDSHDRYANLEVSFLLQQMEAFRGLAILTTNLPDAIDRAFLRRVRFVVRFPFPDREQRAAIWQRVFPPGAPLDSVDPLKLARLHVTGGNIRNIALNAAFLAADAAEPVRMVHVRHAAIGECAKIDAPINEDDIRDWV